MFSGVEVEGYPSEEAMVDAISSNEEVYQRILAGVAFSNVAFNQQT